MAYNNSIAPFPANIDREHFASWFSGLTDGEGCFLIGMARGRQGRVTPFTKLTIGLRDDDREILEKIQSFFGCGVINHNPARGTHNPKDVWIAAKNADLVSKIVPHFDKYPLLAKKRRDFLIWRDAVFIVQSNVIKARVSRRGTGNGKGRLNSWDSTDIAKILLLKASLHRLREYKSVPVPYEFPPSSDDMPLFPEGD